MVFSFLDQRDSQETCKHVFAGLLTDSQEELKSQQTDSQEGAPQQKEKPESETDYDPEPESGYATDDSSVNTHAKFSSIEETELFFLRNKDEDPDMKIYLRNLRSVLACYNPQD